MRLADHYDVICSGGGLSSYLCAALLAKAGKKVLVIDEDEQARSCIYHEKHIFDPDFTAFAGLDGAGALGRSLVDLGVQPQFHRSDDIIQVMTADYRIKFSKNPTMTRQEIERELYNDSDEVARFFTLIGCARSEIPSFVETVLMPGQGRTRHVSAWKQYWKRYYAMIQRDHPVSLASAFPNSVAATCENLGAAILGATSYASPVNLGCEQSIRGLALSFCGPGYYVGGMAALIVDLARIIVSMGGAVKRGSRVESLISESSRLTGVLLSSFEGIVRSEVIVLSSRLRRLYDTLPESLRDPSTRRGLRSVVPVSWRFTIAITVNRDVVPIGATSSMTYVGSYQFPLEEENYLRIQIIPDELYGEKQPRDTVTLLVTALVPYRASSMDYSYLRRLGGKMLRVLSEVMPFLEYNIVSLYPDFRSSDVMLREVYPFGGPDWLPENLMQYYVHGHRLAQDFWGPSWTTAHPNLYFAGRSIWPALGIYGEALTARKIFDDVMLPRN